MSRARAVLDRWLDAFNAQDVETLCQIADPAIEIVPIEPATTAPSGTVYRGHAGIRTLVGRGFEHFSKLHLDYSNVEEIGHMLVVPVRITIATGNGAPAFRHAAVVYETAGDRLLRIEAFRDAGAAQAAAVRSTARLSAREVEIVRLLAHGRTAAEAARELVLSPHTVRTHIRNAKEKLGAHTTAELVAMAVRAGAVKD